MAFDTGLLDIFRNVADSTLKSVQDSGVLLYARHQVMICTRMQGGAIRQYGFQGSPQDKKVLMYPQPKVDLRTQYRAKEGAVIPIGDARLSNIPQSSYTREDLTNADFFLIDGVEYNHVNGTLKDSASGIFFELILKKRENAAK